MLQAIGMIATLGVVASIVWFLWSLLRVLFPTRRAEAFKNLKRATLAFAACVAIAVITSIMHLRELPPLAGTSDTQVTEAEEADDGIVGVVLPATTSAPAMRPETTPAAAPAPAEVKRLSSSQEFVRIRNNQRLLVQKLRDPDSARFGNDVVSYKSGAPVVCGTVNAKNAFGGYAGAERYVGMGTTIGVFLASEVEDFDSLWRRVC